MPLHQMLKASNREEEHRTHPVRNRKQLYQYVMYQLERSNYRATKFSANASATSHTPVYDDTFLLYQP